MVVHTLNPSTWEAEVGESLLSLRTALSTKWVPEQPEIHRGTLHWGKKRNHTQKNSKRSIDWGFCLTQSSSHSVPKHTAHNNYKLFGPLSQRFFLKYFLCTQYFVHMPAGQKRASDLITDSCKATCGFWELNSWTLEEQAILFVTEPSLQPYLRHFIK